MADFLAEFSGFPKDVGLLDGEVWVACVDGSSTRKRSGAGVVLISLEGEHLEFVVGLAFTTTNNEAKYEAVIADMQAARELGVKVLKVRSDSQMVAGHIRGEYEVQGKKIKKYLSKVQELERAFKRVLVTRVP